MFVTEEDFNVKPYAIPNLEEGKDLEGFLAFVEKQEPLILEKLLGISFYESFIEALEALPEEWDEEVSYVEDDEVVYGVAVWKSLTSNLNIEPVEGADWTAIELKNKWLLLEKGDKYIVGLKPYKWVGMKAMLIPYIFSKWLDASFDNYGGNGITIANVENALFVNPGRRVCMAWNSFVSIAGESLHNTRLFHNRFVPSIKSYVDKRNTLYGYLASTDFTGESVFDGTFDDTFQTFTTYLNFSFTRQETKNTFGL